MVLRKPLPNGKPLIPNPKRDLTGLKFGRLTVVKEAPRDCTQIKVQWWCQCECGEWTTASSFQLTSNGKKSCGCMGRENRLNPKGRRHFSL